MRRRISSRVFALASLAFMLIVPAFQGTAPGALAAADDPNTPGAEQLGACLEAGRSLSALFLMDRSGSLEETDPGGLRYEGLRAGLEALTDLAGADRDVEAAVSAFDDFYYDSSAVVDWTQLGGDRSDETITGIVDEAKRTTQPQGGTDFVVAMQGAQEDMADRSGLGNCRVVLWFTDGVNDSLNQNWYSDLCRPNGIMDEIRSDDITVIGLHLTQSVPPEDLDQLPAITLGESGQLECGTHPVPEGSSPGIYLSADDAAGLAGVFGRLVNIVEGCTPTKEIGTYIEPGIRKARINIEASGPVASVRLDGPGGESFVAPAEGGFTQDGYTTESIETNGYVSMLLTLPPGKGVGAWIVTPVGVPVAPEQIEFCVLTGLELDVDDSTRGTIMAGSESTLGLIVSTPEGGPADLSVYSSTAPAAAVNASDGSAVPATAAVADAQKGSLTVGFATAPTEARVQVKASVEFVTEKGLVLRPLAGEWPISVNLSAEYPILEPRDALTLSDAVYEEPATGTLVAIGSPLGPTQVCLADMTDLVLPDDAQKSQIEFETGCIDLGPGEKRDLLVKVVPEQATVGAGSGFIPVELRAVEKPDGSRGVSSFNLPTEWRFTDPIQVEKFIALGLAVLLASTLLPLLAVWLANRLTARFDVERLRWVAVDVELIAGRPRRVEAIPSLRLGSGAEQPELLDPNEFLFLNPPHSRRSFAPGLWRRKLARKFVVNTSAGALTFRAQTPWSPFRFPEFWIAAPSNTRLLSNVGAAPHGNGTGAFASGGLELLVVLVIADARIHEKVPRGSLVVLTRAASHDFAALDARVLAAIPWEASLEDLRSAVLAEAHDAGQAGGHEEATGRQVATPWPERPDETDPTRKDSPW